MKNFLEYVYEILFKYLDKDSRPKPLNKYFATVTVQLDFPFSLYSEGDGIQYFKLPNLIRADSVFVISNLSVVKNPDPEASRTHVLFLIGYWVYI